LVSEHGKESFIQIHAWQGSSLVPLFEFHDKRHFMEFYLNFKVPYPKGFFCNDGDHQAKESNATEEDKEG